MAAKHFAVLPRTMGRCGSTWLCDLIDSHPAVTCLGEVFNPGEAAYYGAFADAAGPQRDAAALFAAIEAARPGAAAYGFKAFREDLETDALRRILAHLDAVVFIERKNLTRALVSELHARATKRWHLRAGAELPEGFFEQRIEVDVEQARNRLRNAVETGRILAEMVDSAGVAAVRIEYEQLVAATQGTMDGVFGVLGVAPHAVTSRFRKMHQGVDFVANLDAVNAALGDEFGQLEP